MTDTKQNRVWIELERPFDDAQGQERAALLSTMLSKLGVDRPESVFWHGGKKKYGFIIDDSGHYEFAADGGRWFNLDFFGKPGMNTEWRETGFCKYLPLAEREIIAALIDEILADGFLVSIHDGEDIALAPTQHNIEIRKAVGHTDETHLYLYRADAESACGWIFLVHGNHGDVISDYTNSDTVQAIIDRTEPITVKHQ